MGESGERIEVFYESVGYGTGLWTNDFTSVDERRRAFFCKMGFADSNPAESSSAMELERVSESSGAVSSANGTVQNPDHGERDDFGEANHLANEPEHEAIGSNIPDFGVQDLATTTTITQCNSPYRDFGGSKIGFHNKVKRNWWRKLMSLTTKCDSKSSKSRMSRVNKVYANKKRFKQLSALYTSQEFGAHKGVIWTAKFSPNGQYLATGGQDGVVRVWGVGSADCLERPVLDQDPKAAICVPVIVPDRVFQIDETPLHEFRGHGADVLDLSWSNSNLILSSSADNTVRLWQFGSDECLSVFHHPDFVTCVQFSPIDDGYFVTGSVDGKVRVWGLSQGRVTEWDDTREAVTAVSYQPDGKGLVAGLINGTCRFYEASGLSIELSEHVQVHGGKRSSGGRISGIQFCADNPERVIVTSEDSKIRVFDKTNLIKKYRGLSKSGTQTSATLTPTGKHILSVGEDSRVYLWDYNGQETKPPSKHPKSTHSCEYFYSQGVSVALTWGGHEPAQSVCGNPSCSQESECVSLAKWFSNEGSSRVTATWPEEMLPFHRHGDCGCNGAGSPTCGLVIVTASCDGMIRVFHNYGLLPSRV